MPGKILLNETDSEIIAVIKLADMYARITVINMHCEFTKNKTT